MKFNNPRGHLIPKIAIEMWERSQVSFPLSMFLVFEDNFGLVRTFLNFQFNELNREQTVKGF